MSDSIESLHTKIVRATDLESVVSTMKALAASNIGQYEKAVLALSEYYLTVALGLWACIRQAHEAPGLEKKHLEDPTCVVVFGSDQGLVGRFNDVLADFVADTLRHFPGEKIIWSVGERMHARLKDMRLPVAGIFEVPNSVNAITPLIGQILEQSETPLLYIFHNSPTQGALYKPVRQRLLPLDKKWRREIMKRNWPTGLLPEVLGDSESTLKELIGEYLFVSLYKACAESLASENASRLAAMQRAEKNINDLLDDLKQTYHYLRQDAIDTELFDVVSGFEAFRQKKKIQSG